MDILLLTLAEPGERFVDGMAQSPFAQLAMPTVAAATPPEYNLTLMDEKVQAFDDFPETDIAGITLHTTLAPRAYAIARMLKKRGTYVVLGGPHVTALPNEALQYADAVVVGDCEDTWPRVLEDFRKGRSEKIYRSNFIPLDDIAPPRLDLLDQGAYPTMAVTHATRGCPYRCEFCSVPGVSGKLYRHRPVEKVAEEVRHLKGPCIVFWDDNLTSDRAYAEALFEAIKPLKRVWIGQATTVFARDRELVRKAAEAGCIGLFLGIESFSMESLRSVKKGFNRVDKYHDAVNNLHDYGIIILAGMIFGFDADDPSVFEATLEYAAMYNLDLVNFNMLTPFPGTPLYDRIKQEGRLLTSDWSKYQPNKHVVFKPKSMSPEELVQGHRWAVDQFYSPMPMFKRLFNTSWWPTRTNLRAKYLSSYLNLHYWKVKRIFDWDDNSVAAFDDVPPRVEPQPPEALPILGQG